jgi:hypothetical protein
LYVRQPPSYVPLVMRTVAEMDVLPLDVQVAPVMPPPPLLDEDELLELLEDELLVLELLLDEEPLFEYEQ